MEVILWISILTNIVLFCLWNRETENTERIVSLTSESLERLCKINGVLMAELKKKEKEGGGTDET